MLLDLARSDPAHTIEISDTTNREAIPGPIRTEMEIPISTMGDCSVRVQIPRNETSSPELVERTVTIGGKTYPAIVYGRRLIQGTKRAIPLHGILLNGTFVLSESTIREVPGSQFEKISKSTDTAPAMVGPGVIGEMAGNYFRFPTKEAPLKKESTARAEEETLGPLVHARSLESFADDRGSGSDVNPGSNNGTPNNGPAWTRGAKKVIVIRCDFSDLQGCPISGSLTYDADTIIGSKDTAPIGSGFYSFRAAGLL